jgi:diguanylate cyclase (GGDEF)-like protein/PAS domain S-box-containing protein
MAKLTSKYRLTTGFAIALGLMALLLVVGLTSMASIQHRLKVIVDNNNVKTALVTAMREATLESTATLYRMIIMKDPLERDEQFLLFNQYAATFSHARTALLALDLSGQEKAVLRKQAELTGPTVVLQERVVKMAMRGQGDQAVLLLHQEATHVQDKVFAQLTELKNIQRDAAERAGREASAAYDRARSLVLLLGGAALLIGGFVAWIVRRASTQAEARLFREKERAQVTLHSIGEGVITTDSQGNVSFMNQIAENLTGWSQAEAQACPLFEVFNLLDEQGHIPAENPVKLAIKENCVVNLEQHYLLVRRDGHEFAIEVTAAPVPDYDQSIGGAVLVFRNVTALRDMASQMAYQASHDNLTGLINRREFEARLELALLSARYENKQHVMCYMDLDQFKVVNDTCGHIAGDELLKQLSMAMKGKVRKSDTLGRLGGDEFGLLLADCHLAEGSRTAEDLLKVMNDFRFTWQDKLFDVSASIGIVPITADSGTIVDVLSAADSACYAAKDLGRNRLHVYRENDAVLAQRHGEMQWLPRIRQALEQDQFRLYFQQVQSLVDGKIHAIELLIRMADDDGKLIPPMAFLPAAERYGLMPSIDRWVIETALDMMKQVQAQANSDKDVLWAINLSGQSLCDDQFIKFVVERLKQADVDLSRICFEITETAAVANLSRAIELINTLKKMGCRFALDDFGSGLSSFIYLKNLPVDYLKIDGSFVKGMVEDPMDRAMVESINQIGQLMGLKTIAEFAENEAIIAELKALRIDFVQGYGIHRPEPLIL